jgi:hypothetical protein
MGEPKQFPVLLRSTERKADSVGCPSSVPWSLLAPHEERAWRNHGQTLQRLAERGGLGPDEMCAIIEGRRWRQMEFTESVSRLLELTAELMKEDKTDG